MNLKTYIKKYRKILNQQGTELKRLFVFFVIGWIVRIITGLISILSGYSYIELYTRKVFDMYFLTSFTASLLLIVIEVASFFITSLFLYYCFIKFWSKKTLFSFLFTVLIFGISIIASIQGISTRQTAKIDNSDLLYAQFYNQKDSLNSVYNADINRINDLSKQIYKSTWKGRNSQEQLEQIAQNNAKILVLKDELSNIISTYQNDLKVALSENKQHKTTEKYTYIWIISVILFGQFIANGFIVYYDIKVDEDSKTQLEILEARIAPNTDALMKNTMNKASFLVENIVNNVIDTVSRKMISPMILEAEQQIGQNRTELDSKKQIQIEGFKKGGNINTDNIFRNKLPVKKRYIYDYCLKKFGQPLNDFEQLCKSSGLSQNELADEIESFGKYKRSTIISTFELIQNLYNE